MSGVLLLPLISLVSPFAAVPDASVTAMNPVSTMIPAGAPASCATYSIEGSLGSASPSADVLVPQLEISATAYLHEGGDPLAGHRVIAVFEMADGVAPIAPVDIVTDADGRASILLPVGAIGVSFRAESAAIGECPDVAPGDVPVVVVDVPVLPPGFGESDQPVPAPAETPRDPETRLPVTGPGETLTLVAGLVLAAGLGTLATRVRRTAEEPGGFSR